MIWLYYYGLMPKKYFGGYIMKYYIVKKQDGSRAFRSQGQWLTDEMVEDLRSKGYTVYSE
jgi:hypothetical protein